MNFVIFGQARTGSSLFVTLLQSHPQVQCAGELLGYDFWPSGDKRFRGRLRLYIRRFPEPYLMWAAARSTRPAYGFKLLYAHVAAPHRLLLFLFKRRWQVIHIQRRRLFDLAMSRSVAIATGHFGEHMSSGRPNVFAIEIPPTVFAHQVGQCINIRRNELAMLKGIPHLTVTYESDLLGEEDRNRICSVIFAALHVEPHRVSTARDPTWARPYSDIVTNYAELQTLMNSDKGIGWQAAWDYLFQDESDG